MNTSALKEEIGKNTNKAKLGTNRNICSICGAESIGEGKYCSVCFDEQFLKLQKDHDENISQLNALYKDMFKICFDLTEEYTKSMYYVIQSYLETQKRFWISNPSTYYISMAYQDSLINFSSRAIQGIDLSYTNLAQVYKMGISAASSNLIMMMNNAGLFSDLCRGLSAKKKNDILEEERFLKTIADVNKTYDSYDKEKIPEVDKK